MRRDPKRIEEISALIQKVWEKNPDLRLMQLLCSVIGTGGMIDPYYVEDDILVICLRQYLSS